MKTKNLKLNNRVIKVMLNGKDDNYSYTPQSALLIQLESHPATMRKCIKYIDQKRDEVRK